MASETEQEGMNLEDAVRGVDAREYIELLDAVRNDPAAMHRFVTCIAKEAPPLFRKFADKAGVGANKEVDDLIRADKHIEAIKLRRAKSGDFLKEAKAWVDARRIELGLRPPTGGV